MTDLRSGGRKLSFDVLTTSASFFDSSETPPPPSQSQTNHRRKRKKKNKTNPNTFIINSNCTAATSSSSSVIYEKEVVAAAAEDKRVISSVPELRQRTSFREDSMFPTDENVNDIHNVNDNNHDHDNDDDLIGSSGTIRFSDAEKQTGGPGMNGHCVGGGGRMLEKDKSLDWRQLLPVDDDPNYNFLLERSPVKYFMEEMHGGNSLRTTTTLANEKDRERVYDTIFRMPWRCELIIDVGFFVCLDSFLSLLTIMPIRLVTTSWRLLKTRQFKMLSAAELSDFGCFLMLASGVILLQQTDISLIYHMIRGQGTIKLYVVYNVLEIFDKLCQNFGGDVLQTLFNTADGLANSSSENMRYWLWRFISDEALAVASSIVHSFILLAQAITLSTCIVAHNNALFALLVSNNFSEIKSNVFKRFSKENIQSLVYFDSIERFHIASFLVFVLAQNILEAEGPWFQNFLYNALVVYLCELMIDIIKHSFIAKFNEIKPIVYSEFLEDLCKQTLNMEPENSKKNLTFVPLAPACVVIRVLSPVYAAHLPSGPILWRLMWILILTVMTFVMVTSLKVLIGMGLHKHATWYIKRCQKRKLHSD